MDIGIANNLYDGFCIYQSRLIEQLDKMAEEYGFITIDANRSVQAVNEDLKAHIRTILDQNS